MNAAESEIISLYHTTYSVKSCSIFRFYKNTSHLTTPKIVWKPQRRRLIYMKGLLSFSICSTCCILTRLIGRLKSGPKKPRKLYPIVFVLFLLVLLTSKMHLFNINNHFLIFKCKTTILHSFLRYRTLHMHLKHIQWCVLCLQQC